MLQVPQPGTPFPGITFSHRLQAYDRCTSLFTGIDIAKGLREKGYKGKIKIRGFYEDGIGRVPMSKKLAFDIDEWLKGESTED